MADAAATYSDESLGEILIQHVPSLAYGEEISVITPEEGDRRALSRPP